MRGEVSFESFARPGLPRHSPNSRPPRRTRRSVRPAQRSRVSDRTVVRPRAARALSKCPQGPGAQAGGDECGGRLLQKDPVHPELSRASASEVGLIARAEESAQSAMGEYVLDNRSHRTPQGSGVRGRRARLSSAPKHARPRIPCSRLLGPRTLRKLTFVDAEAIFNLSRTQPAKCPR